MHSGWAGETEGNTSSSPSNVLMAGASLRFAPGSLKARQMILRAPQEIHKCAGRCVSGINCSIKASWPTSWKLVTSLLNTRHGANVAEMCIFQCLHGPLHPFLPTPYRSLEIITGFLLLKGVKIAGRPMTWRYSFIRAQTATSVSPFLFSVKRGRNWQASGELLENCLPLNKW